MCRSRRELSNAYFLAKFGFDTEENEPCQVCPLSAYRSPRYPKSSIDVYVTVLSADGGEVAAALTAVSLALAHAQVEMHTLVAGAALWAAPDGLRVDAYVYSNFFSNFWLLVIFRKL